MFRPLRPSFRSIPTFRIYRVALSLALPLICVGGLTAGLTAAPALAAPAPEVSHNINDYVASRLDDFTATMHIEQHDDDAARKINKDFGLIYKLRGDADLAYKEENRLRLDGYFGGAKSTMIVNGTTQWVRIPSVGVKSKMNLGTAPGKRKTLLDVGLISSGYLGYAQGEWVGVKPVEGVMCAVFNVSYRDKIDTSHRLVWIDPKTKVTLKREEYSQKGTLNCTYFYRDPKEVAPGIWFPSRIEVLNNEGRRAGVTSYKNVKVNQGLDDSLFRL